MTNTRITDPEIFERRFPVRLHRFELRTGSGGSGAHTGGDGIIREVEFLRPLTVSLLTERRARQPFGMHGGGAGQLGLNLLHLKGKSSDSGNSDSGNSDNNGNDSDVRTVSLGGKNTVKVNKGDRVEIRTPGGGGWGKIGGDAQLHSNTTSASVDPANPPIARFGGSLTSFQNTQETN
jgi:5-oxoprolinase (ATP-hydrolysing)